MGNEYSALKMVRHYIRDGGLPAAPKQVQVVLSDLCNQDCNFCAYRMSGYSSNELFLGSSEAAKYGHNNPKRMMSTDRALRLVEEIKRAGCSAIQWTGGGEPTVQPDHEEIFRHSIRLGLRNALVSNGLRWSDTLISQVLPCFDWVRVSLDAGTPGTYAKIRNTAPDNFGKVLGNVSRLANAIHSSGSQCVLGIGWVITPDNYHEIVEGIEEAASSGAAYVRLSAMFNPAGAEPYAKIHDEILAAIREATDMYGQEPDFTIHNLYYDRLEDLVDGPPDYRPCAYQHYTAYVGGDLNVYRCCVQSYSKRGMVTATPSIADRPFDEFWADPARAADFAAFDARGCERCQFQTKNRAMAYILEPTVSHEEFP